MDNLTQNGRGTADTAEAEERKAAADLGKFKDVQALLSAYESLEAEFTRRSQRLKELEEKSKAQDAPAAAENAPEPSSAHNSTGAEDADARERIIGEYLRAVSMGRTVPFVTGGVSVPAPRSKPATIREAGRLAEQFLNTEN